MLCTGSISNIFWLKILLDLEICIICSNSNKVLNNCLISGDSPFLTLENINFQKLRSRLLPYIIFLYVNSFSSKFLKWPLPALNLDMFTVADRRASQKTKTEWKTM